MIGRQNTMWIRGSVNLLLKVTPLLSEIGMFRNLLLSPQPLLHDIIIDMSAISLRVGNVILCTRITPPSMAIYIIIHSTSLIFIPPISAI